MPPFVLQYGSCLLCALFGALAMAPPAIAQRDERDERIDNLQRRIDALERRLEAPPAPPPAPSAKPPVKPPAEEAAQKDESARALERTLVREGGLVLPAGAFEVEPRLEYTYRGTDALAIFGPAGLAQIGPQDVKRNELQASLGFRAGLPHLWQVELRLPFVWLHENRAFGATQSESERASGWGDLELGAAKQLLAERPGRPSVLASINWKTRTGDSEAGRLSPGNGFHQLQAAFTAVKRQDPLVFVGTLSYAAVLDRARDGSEVDPGDALGLKAGALLAASPETSLRAGFELSRSSRTKIAGSGIPGSDATVAMLELGFASLLSPRTLVDLQFAIGLTPDSPDFQLRLSLPVRF